MLPSRIGTMESILGTKRSTITSRRLLSAYIGILPRNGSRKTCIDIFFAGGTWILTFNLNSETIFIDGLISFQIQVFTAIPCSDKKIRKSYHANDPKMPHFPVSWKMISLTNTLQVVNPCILSHSLISYPETHLIQSKLRREQHVHEHNKKEQKQIWLNWKINFLELKMQPISKQ